MAKVLISSIGEGRPQSDGSYSYESATYFLVDGDQEHQVETRLIISALKELYSIDKTILIGTSGSDWASLYAHLFIGDDNNLSNSTEYSDEYYAKLTSAFNSSKQNPPTLIPIEQMQSDLLPLKEAIGEFCDSIWVMHYGTNQDELNENFLIMNEVAKRLEDGDEVYFDISHSFRSLPLYELLAVNLAKQINGKKLEIEAITYGMFTSNNMFGGRTPIIDLSQLVNITDWMKAVEEFNRFGTTHLLAELLSDDSLGLTISKEERKALVRLGNMATLIKADEFRSLVKNCVNIAKREKDLDNTQIVLGHIFKTISDTFGDLLADDAQLFSELSKWHFIYKRYIESVITLDECLFDFFAQLIGVNRNKKSWEWNRDELPFRYKVYNADSDNSNVKSFLLDFKRLNEIRNHLTHGGSVDYNVRDLSYFTSGMIGSVENQLSTYTKHFSTLIKNFRSNDLDLSELKTAILEAPDSRYADY